MKKYILFFVILVLVKSTYSQGNWQSFDAFAQFNPVFSNTSIHHMDVFLDNNENVWVIVNTSIGRLVSNNWSFINIPASGFNPYIEDVVFDDENDAWVLSTGVFRIQNGTATTIANTNWVRGIRKFSGDQHVYLFSANKIVKVDPANPGNQITVFEQNSDADWIELAKGINNELIFYKKTNQYDSLLIIEPGNTITPYDFSGQMGQNLLDMKVTSDGTIWMYFTQGSGAFRLYSFNYQTMQFFTVPNLAGLPDAASWNFVTDENDDIWFYYDRHVIKFNGLSFTDDYIHNAPTSTSMGYTRMHFRKDSHSNIWFIGMKDMRRVLTVVNHRGLNTITGTTFIDADQSQSYNSGDLPASFPVETSSGYILSDVDGGYNLFTIPNSVVTLTGNAPDYFQFTTPSTYTLTTIADSNYIRNFGVYAFSPASELSVIHTSTACRPGFSINQWISYTNNGTDVESGTIQYTFDPRLTFHSSEPEEVSVSENVITWNYNNLAPLSSRGIHLLFTLDFLAQTGDTLNGTVEINPLINDVIPDNNIFAVNNPITGSFDPNDKTAIPAGDIHSGDWINYIIRFQNTGNDTAFNVYLLDSLSPSLDFSTLSINGYSHNVRYSLTSGWLEFWFDNILLPDSNTNELLSHGYVSYKIKTKTDLTPGTEIENKTEIYFDYNLPITTNSTLNTIVIPNSINAYHPGMPSIFPNPAGNTISLQSTISSGFYKLNDITGKTLLQGSVPAPKFTLDISTLSSGVYFISVSDGERQMNGKVVKE